MIMSSDLGVLVAFRSAAIIAFAAVALRAADRGFAPVARALRAGSAKRALVSQDTDAARRRHCGRRGDDRYRLRRLVFLVRHAVASQALLIVFAAVILIAGVGAADDIRSIAVAPRLLLQALAVTLVIYTLPNELRVAPFVPWWAERILLVIGGLWFVNLVNFMDGLDWMTVAEVVPITAALAVVGWLGALPPPANDRDACALRSDDRFCLFQSAGRQAFPRRRRQPADRLAARLALAVGRDDRTSGGGNLAAALLSRRRDHHLVPPPRPPRAGLAGPSHAFLSAGDRPRLYRHCRLSRGFSSSTSHSPRWRS